MLSEDHYGELLEAEAFATAVVQNGSVRFRNGGRFERGATWTYITTDQPFGSFSERIMEGLRRILSKNET